MELDTVPSEEDEPGTYVPLERPSCSVELMVQQSASEKIVYSDEDEGQISSSSDDSDNILTKNRLKRKLPSDPPSHPYATHNNSAKKKKYLVWSNILQEEAIENSFIQSKFFGDHRGNESYNYRMKNYSKGNGDFHRKDAGKNRDGKFRKKLKAFSNQRASKILPVILPDLKTTVDDTVENVALEIAKNLNEPKTELIERVVNALGKQKAIYIYQQTKQAEQNGGILTLDCARRRTSGGVYLKFVKDQKLPRKEYEAIFNYSDDLIMNAYKLQKRKSLKLKGAAKETKESDLHNLPFRYELEIPNPNEESDTAVLKNPPPSPV